jgi:serine/threonine protein kinase
LLRRKETEEAFLVERLRVALDIADGLKYIHSHGICHRDLHLTSIGFSSTDQVQITSFGKARRQKRPLDDTSAKYLTVDHSDGVAMLVSPSMYPRESEYRAPDSSTKSVESGTKQDVLAYSRILCEILTMRSCEISISSREGTAYIRAFRALAFVIPKQLWGLLQKGLSNEVVSRPSMSEFHECLIDVIFSMTMLNRDPLFLGSGDPRVNMSDHRRCPTRRQTQLAFHLESDDMHSVDGKNCSSNDFMALGHSSMPHIGYNN